MNSLRLGRLGQTFIKKGVLSQDGTAFLTFGLRKDSKAVHGKQLLRQYTSQGSSTLEKIADYQLYNGQGPNVKDVLTRISCIQLILGRMLPEVIKIEGKKGNKRGTTRFYIY